MRTQQQQRDDLPNVGAHAQKQHFESFAADRRLGEGEYYDLVGIKADGTRVTITKGGSIDEGGDGHLGPKCPITVAESLNDDEDLAKMIGLTLDLVWGDDHMTLVPVGQPFSV